MQRMVSLNILTGLNIKIVSRFQMGVLATMCYCRYLYSYWFEGLDVKVPQMTRKLVEVKRSQQTLIGGVTVLLQLKSHTEQHYVLS